MNNSENREKITKEYIRDLRYEIYMLEKIVTSMNKPESINEKHREIALLKHRLNNINDDVIDQKIQEYEDRINKKRDVKLQRRQHDKQQHNHFLSHHRSEERACNYERRRRFRDIKYFHNYYKRAVVTLPNNMYENLKDMPNNKGYLWRGIQFFGTNLNRPIRNIYDFVLFEKRRGRMLIHEWTRLSKPDANSKYQYQYKLFEKKGNNHKRLVKNEIVSKPL